MNYLFSEIMSCLELKIKVYDIDLTKELPHDFIANAIQCLYPTSTVDLCSF